MRNLVQIKVGGYEYAGKIHWSFCHDECLILEIWLSQMQTIKFTKRFVGRHCGLVIKTTDFWCSKSQRLSSYHCGFEPSLGHMWD